MGLIEKSFLKQYFMDKLTAMLGEVEDILGRKEKYLDPLHAVERTSGDPLYERFEELCNYFRKDFPEHASRLVVGHYKADTDRELCREELQALYSDIRTFFDIVAGMGNSN